MFSWNYRIIRKRAQYNHVYFEIHEVHYSADGVAIENWTVSPIAPYGETLDELRGSMKLMAQAFERPVLDLKVVDGKETLVEWPKRRSAQVALSEATPGLITDKSVREIDEISLTSKKRKNQKRRNDTLS